MDSPVEGVEIGSPSWVLKSSLESPPSSNVVEDMDDPRCECVEPKEVLEFGGMVGTLFAGLGTMGGSLLVTAKERMVSTPPLFRARETKHDKLSTKCFLSFFMFLKMESIITQILSTRGPPCADRFDRSVCAELTLNAKMTH